MNRSRDAGHNRNPRSISRVLSRPLWLAGIAASAGAGLIHLAHGPVHLEELGAIGAGFYLAAALQLGWAVVALAMLAIARTGWWSARTATLTASGIAINGTILAAWVMSRVVGLPAGAAPWTPEAIGMADGITAILQVMLVVGLTAALRGWRVPSLPRAQRFATAGAAIAILLIATGTAVATSPAELGHAHAPGYEHIESDEHVESDGQIDDAESHHHGEAAGG